MSANGGGGNSNGSNATSNGSSMVNTGNCGGVNNGKSSRVCRDFVRGKCRRMNCRFPHVLSPELVVFCHDYQNSSCPRMNCKFLHYTLQEEEYYRKFGEFPSQQPPPPQQQPHPVDGGHNYCRGPMCNGSSSSNFSQCHSDRGAGAASEGFDSSGDRHVWNDHMPTPFMQYRANGSHAGPGSGAFMMGSGGMLKRMSCDTVDSMVDSKLKRYREDSEAADIMQIIRRFDENQSILRRRVEAIEIKIAELHASNEYLMAQLRNSNAQQPQQCSAIVNSVTVTPTTTTCALTQQQNPQPPPPQVIGRAVSIAPVQMQATPIVSIATAPAQIIAAANSAAPALALAAATTSQAQQQIAIAAATPQSLTSLANTSQSLQTAHAPQILGTSQITLTPVAPPPSMGLAINTSQATLSMSNATPQPIISYPVMTHSLMPHQ